MTPRTVVITLTVETDFPTKALYKGLRSLQPGAANTLFKVKKVAIVGKTKSKSTRKKDKRKR